MEKSAKQSTEATNQVQAQERLKARQEKMRKLIAESAKNLGKNPLANLR